MITKREPCRKVIPSTHCSSIGVGSKFEVQRPCCVARSAAKRMEIYFAARSAAANFLKMCTFRLQNKAIFQRCIII